MSLRDALVKAGAVDKKKVREVERELKQERKQQQAHRERKHIVEAKAREEAREARERLERERLAARKAREQSHDAAARRQSIRQMLRHHGLQPAGGPARFYHRSHDGRLLLRLDLPWTLARALRIGGLGLAALENEYADEVVYLLIPRQVAERIASLDPSNLVFFNATPPDPADPAETLLDENVGRTVLRSPV